MLGRIALIVISIVLAWQMMLVGEHGLYPLSPIHLDPQGGLALARFDDIGLFGWSFYIITALAVVLTAIAFLGQLGRLLSAKTTYTSVGRIVYFGLLLTVTACLYGAQAQPVAANGLDPNLWFLQYPRSAVVWIIVGPIAFVLLNFVRELLLAMSEYEKLHGSGKPLISKEQELLEGLSEKVENVKENVVKSHKILKEKVEGVETGVDSVNQHLAESHRKLSERLVAVADAFNSAGGGVGDSDELKEFIRQQFDGIFRQLRKMAGDSKGDTPREASYVRPVGRSAG